MGQTVNKDRCPGGLGAMARNGVQFQKELSEPGFERLYGTEEQCRALVIAARWPTGFECPVCGGKRQPGENPRSLSV
jgi:transposase-like zinc ribbon protein